MGLVNKKYDTAELMDWWSGAQKELVAEYYQDAVHGKEGRLSADIRITDIPGMFELRISSEGVSVVHRPVNYDGRLMEPVGAIGDRQSGTMEGIRGDIVLHDLRENWDAVRLLVNQEVGVRHGRGTAPEKVSDRLYNDIILDDSSVPRPVFYRMTRDYTDSQLDDLRKDVRKRSEDYYKMRFEGGVVSRDVVESELAFNREVLNETFSPWYRLAGKLDWEVFNAGEWAERNGKPFSAEDILTVADRASRNPAYAPYLGGRLAEWVRDTYRDGGFGTRNIPERYRKENTAKRQDRMRRTPQIGM